MDLLELLQVEESLGDGQLVAAARGGQEALELGSVGQLQDELVDLPQRLGIHILELLSLQDGLHEELPHLADIAILQLHLREDLRYRLLEVVLEGGNELTTSSGDQLFAFLEDEWWHDVVVVQGRHLDLYSLDPVPTDEADLCVPALLLLRLSELEGNQPLDLGLDIRILRVSGNVWDVQAPEGKAGRVTAGVDPLDFLEGDVAPCLLPLKRPVVTWPHLGVWVVAWVGELVARTHRVKELDGLVGACRRDKLGL